ncbi:MAG: polyphenol oxidase family protein [Candidatus Kerfeldbacteria bacterium]|nr:polyphenol oxidase family protein [Candidatus Kerfeldbacteria bacterium]
MFYQIPQLTKYNKLLHAFSTKDDGNMSFKWGIEEEVRQNRQKFLTDLNIDPSRVVSAELEHSDKIIKVTAADAGQGVLQDDYQLKGDCLITNELGLYLWHVVADCLSVMLYDPMNQTVALVHVGRKNANLQIINKTIKAMAKFYNTKPNDLVAGIGPSIHSCCYAYNEIEQTSDPAWHNFLINKNNLIYIDLVGFTAEQLLDSGVVKNKLYLNSDCTAHSNEFFSHYRAKQTSQPEKRFAAIIGPLPCYA